MKKAHILRLVSAVGACIFAVALFSACADNDTKSDETIKEIQLMKVQLKGENIFVRTPYNEEYDLIQQLIGINSDGKTSKGEDHNEPVDFSNSGLVPKDSEEISAISTYLANGVDEVPSFEYNRSYIGANHGQSDGVQVKSENHGKTYADIGSLWEDEAGVKWNLLKVLDENTLLFLSENMTDDIDKYEFTKTITGTTLVCAAPEYAESEESITVGETLTSVQVYPSINKQPLEIYAVNGKGKEQITSDGVYTCETLEIHEKYQIMNPALIGETLRAARPEGGYTEPQNLAIGKPMFDFYTIYKITSDGTVVYDFDHMFLENVNFNWYAGAVHRLRLDTYGGGTRRYIPKTKTFDVTYKDKTMTYDFTEPVNLTEQLNNNTFMAGGQILLTKETWENPEIVPDRQIDYFFDTDNNPVAGYAIGFLPIADAEPEARLQKARHSTYLYKSGKAYPTFVTGDAFPGGVTKNKKMTGVGYKKYVDFADSTASMYTVPYGDSTYIYIDFHTAGTKTFDLSDILSGKKLKELEKSQNISYSAKKGVVNVTMQDGTYGYLVLLDK